MNVSAGASTSQLKTQNRDRKFAGEVFAIAWAENIRADQKTPTSPRSEVQRL